MTPEIKYREGRKWRECSIRQHILKEYSSLQDNPYNVRYIHNVLIIHIYFAPQAVDNV